jgi:hypothetical protein
MRCCDFQEMDGAGKDGAIRHVMSGVNPQGCQVFSFKQPSADELEHGFLWRTTCRLPERGHIGTFNHSYYEEVLVVGVHPEILLRQGLSEELRDEKTIWEQIVRLSLAFPGAAYLDVNVPPHVWTGRKLGKAFAFGSGLRCTTAWEAVGERGETPSSPSRLRSRCGRRCTARFPIVRCKDRIES